MEEIIKNYNTVLEQIRISADEADRNMDEIKLIIVTKKFDVESIKPLLDICLLYTSPSPRDPKTSRMPSSA